MFRSMKYWLYRLYFFFFLILGAFWFFKENKAYQLINPWQEVLQKLCNPLPSLLYSQTSIKDLPSLIQTLKE